MNILVFGNGSLSIAQQERKLCVEFAKKGHSVFLLCNENLRLFNVGDLPVHSNLKIFNIPFGEYRFDRMIQETGFPQEVKFDVVLGMDQSVVPFVADFKARTAIRSYVIFLDLPMHVIGGKDPYNYNMQYSQRFFYWLTCSLELDGVIFNNGVAVEQYRKMYNRDSHLVFYAISDDSYLNKVKEDPTKDYVFGCNRLIKYKGTEYTLLSLKGTEFPYRHAYVSGEPQEIQNVKALARGLTQKVVLHEKTSEDEKMELAYNAKVVVYPQITDWVGGLSIIEAWSVKTPGICFNYPVLKELYGDCVLYAKPRSVIELRACIQELYKDEEKNKELAEKGYERFKTHFTREVMATNLLKVLSE